MDYVERKTVYIELMRACQRTQAAGDAEAAIEAFEDLEAFACAMGKEYRNAHDAELLEQLEETLRDAVSYIARQAEFHEQAGDANGAEFLRASIEKIRRETGKRK